MGNTCYNTVLFKADPLNMTKLKLMFQRMAKNEASKGKAQLPPRFKSKTGQLSAIRWEDGTLYYDTESEPNFEVMIHVASQLNVSFSHSYYDLNVQLFGEAEYNSGMLKDVRLQQGDFEAYKEAEEWDTYLFEGQTYDLEWEILDILLDRRKKHANT